MLRAELEETAWRNGKLIRDPQALLLKYVFIKGAKK
jgi:hypothetical protein